MIIFTDGSTINNGKKNAIGGLAIYIPSQNDINISEYKLSYSLQSTNKIKVTNQVSELIAVILGIEASIKLTTDTIYVYTDSKYVIDCATTWCKSWINNNWKKSTGKIIDNLWLIYRLVQLTKKYPIIFKHIKAHTNPPNNKQSDEYLLWEGNHIVDELAQNASRKLIEYVKNKDEDILNEIKILKWNTLAALMINGVKKDYKSEIPLIDEISDFYKENFGICDNLGSDDELDSSNSIKVSMRSNAMLEI